MSRQAAKPGHRKMERIAPSCRVLGFSITAAILVGCGVLPLSSSKGQLEKASPKSGGSFTASYSGAYSNNDCRSSKRSRFEFHGNGTASFLGSGTEQGKIRLVLFHGFCQGVSGTSTFANTSGDSVTAAFTTHYSPACGSDVPVDYRVTGGTGKFAHATGSGQVTFTCFGPRHDYVDSSKGTLYFFNSRGVASGHHL